MVERKIWYVHCYWLTNICGHLGRFLSKEQTLKIRNKSDSFNPKDIIWWGGLWQTNSKCRESLWWIFAIKILVKLFPHPAYISSCTFPRPSKNTETIASSHRRLIFYRRWKDHTDVTKIFPYLWSPAVPPHQLILTVSARFHADVFERLPNGSKVHLNLGSCRLGSACFSVTANIPAFSSAWLDATVVRLGAGVGAASHTAQDTLLIILLLGTFI